MDEEHKSKLLNIQSHLEFVNNVTKKRTKFGEHYEDCIWSNKNTRCGPDTCHCNSYDRKSVDGTDEANRIIQLYYNICNITKCKKFTFETT